MALNYSLLQNKSKIEYKSSTSNYKEEVIDLLSKTYNDDIDFSEMFKIVEVTKEYEARPDLVSLALYQTDGYADIICKINGISNPFELAKGNILICPSVNIVGQMSKLSNSVLDGLAEDNSQLVERYNTYKKNREETRSPNESTVFDHTYTEIPNSNLLVY